MMYAPVVLFVYNRPEHTRRTLESLRANELSADSELFVYADGPKATDDEGCRSAIRRVRQIIREQDWCGKQEVIESDTNKGLANSVIGGVSAIVNRYGKVIVVEDDLVVSPRFLRYMNDALDFYAESPRVKHIAAYMYPISKNLPETFFYRAPSCWGWATWERAWREFDPDASLLKRLIEARKRVYEFNIEDNLDFFNMLEYQIEGKIDSWAIRWYASVFIKRGLCLHPGRSLVLNIGHDGSGAHCGVTDRYFVKPNPEPVRNFATDLSEDEHALEEIRKFLAGLRA